MTLRDGVPKSFSNASFLSLLKSLIVVNLPCDYLRPAIVRKRGIIERKTDSIVSKIPTMIQMML